MSSATELIRARRLATTGAGRALREEAGLSLAELSAAAKVHKSTLFRWEHGMRRQRGDAAIRYLRVLEELGQR